MDSLSTDPGAGPELVPETEERLARIENIDNSTIDKPEYHEGVTTMFGVNVLNSKEWRQAEVVSANVSASARGLAKLGTWMAQKGTADGKTIMSEEAWEEFHGGLDKRFDFKDGVFSTFTNGGVALEDLCGNGIQSKKLALPMYLSI